MQPEQSPVTTEISNGNATIYTEEYGDYAIVRPEGYLNALIGDQIDKACSTLIDKGVNYIIINFSKVSMVNTIGISILIGIIEKVLQKNGLVYFTELGTTGRHIFEVLNLSTVALMFESDDNAREHMYRDQEAVRRASQA